MGAPERSAKRKTYFGRLQKLLDKYPKLLIVCADHVGSRQMAQIRHALRGKAVVLMGKNTMIRTCLRKQIPQQPQLEKLLPLVKENIGFIFCIDDPSEVRSIIMEHKVPAPARQGVVAPIDVFIPAGPTGMDPGSTSFFQALGISTKIVKGQIEIQTEVHLIKADEKVTASAATLLQKLDIRPFEYGLKTVWIYDDGSVFSADVLDITDAKIISQFQDGAKNIAALSRQIGLPTAAAVPHSIIEAFKVCTSLVLDSDFTFPQMQKLKAYLENPEAFAVAAAPAAGGGGSKAAVVKEEEPEEEEDDLGFSLFD